MPGIPLVNALKIAGLCVLLSAPAFAGRVVPLDVAASAGSGLGRFPTSQVLEAAPREDAPAYAPAPAAALLVPPNHVASVITSIASGNWSAGTTWSGGVVPTAADDVVIADGTAVTIDANGACNTLTVGQGASGSLQYEAATARTLSVAGSVTVAPGGAFRSAATGSVTAHALTVGGSLVNNGTLDFSTNANAAGAGITFTGFANATFGGSGATTDIRTIAVNKGASAASVLELNPAAFTVRGASVNTSTTTAMLTLVNGTFKIGGTFAGSNALSSSASWTIPASAGLWLANPNYTIAGLGGTLTNSGTLTVDAGTLNVGTLSGNRLAYTSGAAFVIHGGTINVAGRLSPTTNGCTYTQTGGVLNITTVDNPSTTNAGFDLQSGSTFNMSGGTIALQRAASVAGGPRDYRNFASTVNITGGTLQLGTGSSPGGQTFTLQGWAPAVSVTTLGGNHAGILAGELDALGNTSISANARLTLNGQFYVERGAAIVNSGTIDGSAPGSHLYFFGTSPQGYFQSGVNGTAAAPLANLDVDNHSTLTINAAATTTIVSRVNLFTGGIVNANLLQLGASGASAAVTQIGTAGNTTTGGSYDVAPVFAFGTGGYTLLYEPETVARTTGVEVPPGRALAAMSVNNTHEVALEGGDLAVTALTFPASSGNLTTGANAVAIGAGGSVNRANAATSGWVVGNLTKDAPAGNASRTFEVGTAGYAPVTVALTGVAAPGTLTARTDDGDLTVPAGSLIDGNKSVNRNWTLTASPGLSLASAQGTFQFAPGDVDGGANPSNFLVRKLDGATWSGTTTGTRTATSTQATWSSGFSKFAIGELVSFPVDVAVVGSGSVAKSPDQAAYEYGASVELTATPATGWHFDGWSGDASGTTNPLAVTVEAAKNITATFAVDRFAVTVDVAGSGTVAKSPDQALYDYGSSVELTATPAPGWHFAGWSGDASGATNPLTVTVDAAKNVTATFAIDRFPVDVTVVGNGTVGRVPDQELYDVGSSVELTATPADHWHFAGWSGDASGATNPLTVTVDAAKNVTATFAPDQFALDVAVVGNGTVAKNPDQASYDYGSAVELTAIPVQGWHFAGWSGDAAGTANPLSVTVDAAKNVTATFEINQYAVDVTVAGNGTVARDPDQPLYTYGSVVQLTATPAPDWHFVGWSGNASGNANPLLVTVDAAKNITGAFAIDQYAVEASVVGSGTVAKSPDQAQYDLGSTVELTAAPAPGWHFVEWSGDASGSANPVTVTVDGAKHVTATFEIDRYALDVVVTGNGAVAKNPDQPLYDYGSVVELTATPAPNWHFAGWSGDASGSDNPLLLTVDAAKNVTATFAIDQFAVDVSVVGSGTVAKSPDQAQYVVGTTVELTATPAQGWHFTGWSGDASGSDNPLLLTVDAAKNVTAMFAIDRFAVDIEITGGGSVAKDPDQLLYDYGSSVQLTATPDPGWSFAGWSGDASGHANPLSLTVDAAKNVTATFVDDQFPVAVTSVGNGSVAKSPDQFLYALGSTVELTATPASGWHFVGWSGDASGTDNPLNLTVDAAKNVTATFAIDQYAVDVTVAGSGAVTKNPDQPLYDYGSSVELTATPAPGWHFVGWSGDATGNDNPLQLTVDAAKNVTATFAIDQYAVDVTVTGSGAVAKNPDQPLYDYGSGVELTATPAPGWHFVGWGGDASGNANPLQVTVDAAKSVTATFAIDQYAVEVVVTGSGAVAKNPDQPLYDSGSTVELTAIPAPGWHFTGWGGDASGSDNPLSVTVDAAKNVTATFAIDQYAVEVVVTGSGAVAKNPDQPLYDYGSSLELTATAAPGWHFAGWSGDASGSDNPLQVTVDAAKNVTATFAIDQYAVAVAVVGNGEVAKDPDQAAYDPGSTVALTATPGPGFTFAGWSGDASGSDNPLAVVVDGDKSITATFVDTAAPTAHLDAPDAGPVAVGSTQTIAWTASDNAGVTAISLLLSRTGPSGPFEEIASGLANTGSYEWLVSGPPTTDAVLRVVARDAASNEGSDDSDQPFEIAEATVAVSTPVLRFALLPVVPSPSVGNARLRYELPKDAQFDLTIVDVRGREVARLVHGLVPAGRHVATWNGQTAQGRAPAGVYFARGVAPGARFMQRIVLVR